MNPKMLLAKTLLVKRRTAGWHMASVLWGRYGKRQ